MLQYFFNSFILNKIEPTFFLNKSAYCHNLSFPIFHAIYLFFIKSHTYTCTYVLKISVYLTMRELINKNPNWMVKNPLVCLYSWCLFTIYASCWKLKYKWTTNIYKLKIRSLIACSSGGGNNISSAMHIFLCARDLLIMREPNNRNKIQYNISCT